MKSDIPRNNFFFRKQILAEHHIQIHMNMSWAHLITVRNLPEIFLGMA